MTTRDFLKPALVSPSVKLATQASSTFVALVPALARMLPSDDVVSSLAHLFWFVPSTGYFYALGTRHALEECIAWSVSFLVVVFMWIVILSSHEMAARLGSVKLPLLRRLLILLLPAGMVIFWLCPGMLHDFSSPKYGAVNRLIDTNVVARGIFFYCMTLFSAFTALVARMVFARDRRGA